ncbi:LLM class flavin-dependent oxidoreductase [Macrococcus sp. DPC7161]|uniref:LLM class flavin-dependent oxidoreductase n=1 Tax=Macrococcus sp. DPC7161 TaxID=2507060 RepID=UPI00100BF7F5|nr:LLM class flavin-dependent oxidoreductase [Macrococcus sp. DPC7161]RXK17465.1 LLM class flavin-dependent oxidoreductase [Macrococcus sp. DPC7161]
MKVELGITSFGDNSERFNEQGNHGKISAAERIRDIVEEIKLADEVGLDIYGLGEHHRPDYAVSDPVSVLAAAAPLTNHIKLSSAVTVLSSDDPIRVYQRFATLDALSNGRAEIMAGRGSFIESFPLFGYDLNDYERLYEEKLDLLIQANQNEIVTWEGTTRAPVEGKGVYPRAVQKELPINIASGGTPSSSFRAAQLGLPITYAIIGGNPKRFRQNINLYKQIGSEHGHDLSKMTVSVHSWGFIAETDELAREKYFYPTKNSHDVLAKERGWPAYSMEAYLSEIEYGALYVGSPETVAYKIIDTVEALNLDRFMIHLPMGSMPHEDIMNAIRLYGEKVKPIVDNYFKDREKRSI